MKIAKNMVVTLHYKLSDAQGNLIEESSEPMVYLHGGYENTLPKIEEALDGKEVGYEATVHLEPEDAFGDYDPSLIKIEPRNRLPEPIEETLVFTVTDIADDKVVLDGNHPLAGMALRFSLSVAAVRAATEDEITHQHVHGPHGHHHDHDDAEGEDGDHFRSYPLQ